MTEREYEPDLWCLVLDETQHYAAWSPAAKEGKRLFGVYVYDAAVVTHLCELAPSYECWFVNTVTQERLSDEAAEDLQTADGETEPAMYMHCDNVESYPVVETPSWDRSEADYWPKGMGMRFHIGKWEGEWPCETYMEDFVLQCIESSIYG